MVSLNNEKLREELARAFCLAINVDPDKIGYGLGHTMPKNSTYPLWRAQLAKVDVAISMLTIPQNSI